jgi:hypothetical protein
MRESKFYLAGLLGALVGVAVGYQVAVNTTKDRVEAAALIKVNEWEVRARHWEDTARQWEQKYESTTHKRIGSPAP